jgi:hypothetical protein
MNTTFAPTLATTPRKAVSPRKGRHLRPLQSSGEYARFEIYSLTRNGHEHEHMICIGLEDRSVHCSCEHFSNRFARQWPTIEQPEKHCKHVTRALNYLKRRKQLPEPVAPIGSRPCVSCSVTDAEFGLADERGHAIVNGFICGDCIKRARMMGEDTCSEDAPAESTPAGALDVEDYEEECEPVCPSCGSFLQTVICESGRGCWEVEWCSECDCEVTR